MDVNLEKQVKERLEELPQSIRSAVQSADLHKKIITIGEKHKLHIDQVGELEGEVLMVMMGFSDASTFEQDLVKTLSISPEMSKLLVKDLNDEVFLPIQGAMKDFAARNEPKPELAMAHVMLESKIVNTPSIPAPNGAPITPPPAPSKDAGAPQPKNYSVDPYREPPAP